MTLIEVVAALGIMAIGIVGLLTLFPLGLDASARASDRTTAAILGEYVIEQVRLRQDEIHPTHDTHDALNALDWREYSDPQVRKLTFESDDGDPVGGVGFGSGEMFMKQDPGALTDQELFSRYEVALQFGQIKGNSAFGTAYKDLMQVTVTVRWPRAFHEDARKNQETMTFVTYIRPGS